MDAEMLATTMPPYMSRTATLPCMTDPNPPQVTEALCPRNHTAPTPGEEMVRPVTGTKGTSEKVDVAVAAESDVQSTTTLTGPVGRKEGVTHRKV
jgi:hypothetical protein